MNIRDLTLLAADPVQLAGFYADLGLSVEQHDGNVHVMAGRSVLIFTPSPGATPAPYHFAFNIPQNQFAEAKTWLAARVPLVQNQDGADEIFSADWNSHAVYFYDPAGNIVELIARHTLKNDSEKPFSAASLLNISEIGIVTDDVLSLVGVFTASFGVTSYLGKFGETFTAVGDADGLFIIVKEGRLWFPDQKVAAVALRTVVTFIDGQGRRVRFNWPPGAR